MDFDLNTLQIELKDWKAMVSATISSVPMFSRLFDSCFRAILSYAGVLSSAHSRSLFSDHVPAHVRPNTGCIFSGKLNVYRILSFSRSRRHI